MQESKDSVDRVSSIGNANLNPLLRFAIPYGGVGQAWQGHKWFHRSVQVETVFEAWNEWRVSRWQRESYRPEGAGYGVLVGSKR